MNIFHMNASAGKAIQSMTMLSHDMVEIVFNDNMTIHLKDLKESFEELAEFTQGKRLKKLIIAGTNTKIKKEARNYGHHEIKRIQHTVVAEAIVVRTRHQKWAMNLYFSFIKNTYPAKSFTDAEKAKEWLDQQV